MPRASIGFRMQTGSFHEVHLNKLSLALAASFLLSTFATAQAQPEGSLTSNPVFQQNCAKCHGKTAEGRTFAGPSLVNEKTISMSADNLRTIITSGQHRMPKFVGKLSPEEIDILVNQIKKK
jgi:mono/diheme cytochrome c family protein